MVSRRRFKKRRNKGILCNETEKMLLAHEHVISGV